MALPLVPPLRLDGVYQAIVAAAPNLPQVPAIHQYIVNTYIGNGALFPRTMWNVFNTTDRTTNMCDGFHSKLIKRMSHHSPSIFKVIEFVQELDAVQEINLAQLLLGAAPKRRKSSYVRVDLALHRITHNTFGQGL